MPFLLPGNYSVTAERAGFKSSVRGDIRVGTGVQVTVDFALEVGAATETVNVNGEAPMIETSDSDLGLVMNNNYVANVAVSIYRNAINFARLAPGVTGQPAGTYTSDNQRRSHFRRRRHPGNNEIILDGVPDTVPLSSGSVVYVPSVDSIEEVKVNTTMFDASYGHSNGGAINIVTRGGTNQLHGSVYLFKRWAALNANSWSNDRFGGSQTAGQLSPVRILRSPVPFTSPRSTTAAIARSSPPSREGRRRPRPQRAGARPHRRSSGRAISPKRSTAPAVR